MLKLLLIPILILLNQVIPKFTFAQQPEVISAGKIEQVAKSIRDQSGELSEKINKAALQRLEAIQKQEEQLLKHLPKEELEKALKLKDQLKLKMDMLYGFANSPDSLLKSLAKGPYIARLDSLETLFKFALPSTRNIAIINEAKTQLQKMRAEIGMLEGLETFLADREQQWKSLLSFNGLEKLQLPKAFGKWQEEAMAYKMQVQQWRETIKDPQKMEREALKLLNKLPAFREFMSKNSELARLFGPPAGSNAASFGTPIPGLQTRQSLAQNLQSRFGGNALSNGGVLQQQLQNGMDQLSQSQASPIQELTREFGPPSPGGRGAGGEVSPSQTERAMLKSKTFKKRIESGWNLQSAVRIQDFPAVRDVGLSLGYKVNPRSVIGVGIAYKFALGESWKDIKWTHEGVGLRSFVDWRISSAGSRVLQNIWVTGGFEMNYWRRMAGNVQWKDLAWEKSGLVGVTKTIPGKKTTGKLQILFNYLQTNVPLENRISFRWGKLF